MQADWWKYDNLESAMPYDWSHASRGDSRYDNIDFHLDIGMGTLKKARMGIDRHLAAGVDLCIDLETLTPAALPAEQGFRHQATEIQYERMGLVEIGEDGDFLSRLPFPDNSIESIISHHCLEHIDAGFVHLMDECYRVLVPGGLMRIIVPLFPSRTAVEDPDHKRYFMLDTFQTFCGAPDGKHWHESFSVPYTKCRFELVDRDYTAPVPIQEQWGENDAREIRVALRKYPQNVLREPEVG